MCTVNMSTNTTHANFIAKPCLTTQTTCLRKGCKMSQLQIIFYPYFSEQRYKTILNTPLSCIEFNNSMTKTKNVHLGNNIQHNNQSKNWGKIQFPFLLDFPVKKYCITSITGWDFRVWKPHFFRPTSISARFHFMIDCILQDEFIVCTFSRSLRQTRSLTTSVCVWCEWMQFLQKLSSCSNPPSARKNGDRPI